MGLGEGSRLCVENGPEKNKNRLCSETCGTEKILERRTIYSTEDSFLQFKSKRSHPKEKSDQREVDPTLKKNSPPQQLSQFYDLTASPPAKRKESVGEEMSHVPLREKVFLFFFRESGVKSILCGLFFRGKQRCFRFLFSGREKKLCPIKKL